MSSKNNLRSSLVATITQEECAEVTQCISKVIRFGLENANPLTPVRITNKEHLEIEMGQLIAMLQLLANEWSLDRKNVTKAYTEKVSNYRSWDDEYGN